MTKQEKILKKKREKEILQNAKKDPKYGLKILKYTLELNGAILDAQEAMMDLLISLLKEKAEKLDLSYQTKVNKK